MKRLRLAILAFAAFAAMAVNGQLFHPLGIGIETPKDMTGAFWPQMHVEGDILYVCTKQGLYSKDLSDDESEWQLVGFEGVPLQDYARRGSDILAMRYSYEYSSNGSFLLLSHDGGQTYEDITPSVFREPYHITLLNLVQHPTDPNTLLVSSYPEGGIYKTTDFGQTWNNLSSFTPNYIGFHPLNPEIIYECYGGGNTDEKTDFRISYDGGQTWKDKYSCFPYYNLVYRIAFHPTDPNRWIAGGSKHVHTTNDNGLTWSSLQLDYGEIDWRYEAFYLDWRYAAYDDENADVVYMAGGSRSEYMKVMCSTDGGKTWDKIYQEPIKTTPREFMFDMKQYGDKLLVYSQSDVYEISKAELLAQGQDATSVQSIVQPTKGNETVYDLSGRKINSSFFTLHSSFKKGIYIEGGKKKVK